MSFDASSFLTDTVQSLASGVTSSLGDSLQTAGMSSGGIQDILSSKLDSITGSGGSAFYGFAGKAVERINPQDLELFRGEFNLTTGSDPEQSIPDNQQNSQGTTLTFPPDMGEYYISFQFAEYNRPTPLSTSKFQTNCTINLPLPPRLIDSKKVSYSDENLGLSGGIADLATETINIMRGRSPQLSGKEATQRGVSALVGVTYQASLEGLTSLLGEDGAQAAAAGGQMFGAIPNPHLAKIFTGPTFRVHNFSWILAPNNKDESLLIKKIIKAINARVLPAKALSSAANILDYPQMVLPTLYPIGDDGESLYPFKKAVITDLSVDNAPHGPSFFAGTKLPTLIVLSMTVAEIEYFLADDFGGAGQNSDGVNKILDKLSASGSSLVDKAAQAVSDNARNNTVGQGTNLSDNFFNNSGSSLQGGV